MNNTRHFTTKLSIFLYGIIYFSQFSLTRTGRSSQAVTLLTIIWFFMYIIVTKEYHGVMDNIVVQQIEGYDMSSLFILSYLSITPLSTHHLMSFTFSYHSPIPERLTGIVTNTLSLEASP